MPIAETPDGIRTPRYAVGGALLDRQLRDQLARLSRFAWLYQSPLFAGAGDIVRTYLDLPPDFVLPITFPHGVDTHNAGDIEDLSRIEPVYLAPRPDIADRAEGRGKIALRFPHPWLMLRPQHEPIKSCGTLFVAPPSGVDNNRSFHEAVHALSLPKPWGISLKYRGLDSGDSEWWRERGFVPLSAGPSNSGDFYLNQRRILAQFDIIALAYPSSMSTFAASLGKKVVAIPDVEISFVGNAQSLPFYHLRNNDQVTSTWSMLLGEDRAAAKAKALELLGAPFMAPREELRERLFDAIRGIQEPIYLPTVRSAVTRRLVAAMLARKIPAHKLLPNPLAAGARKLRHLLNCDRPYLIEARLFAHYGIIGDPTDAFRYRRYWSFQLGRRPGLGEGPKKARA
jgi:hypothetical protein